MERGYACWGWVTWGSCILILQSPHLTVSPTDLQSLVLRFNKGRVLAPSAKNFLMCIQHGAGPSSENGANIIVIYIVDT